MESPTDPREIRVEGSVTYYDPRYATVLRAYPPVENKLLWGPLKAALKAAGARGQDTSYFFADQTEGQYTFHANDPDAVVDSIVLKLRPAKVNYKNGRLDLMIETTYENVKRIMGRNA